jgi:hypothetical protein
MSATKLKPKPQKQVTAESLIERIVAVRSLNGEIDQRGGILKLMDEAQADEPTRKQVNAALEASWKGLRAYVIQIGDDRRAKHQALPLCWLPGDGERA